MTIRTRTPLLLGALALALTACSGGGEEPPADANTAEEAPVVENMDFNNMVEPTAPNTATPLSEPSPDENATAEEPARDVQQDDADAVGMTARVDRSGGEDGASANDTQPVDEEK